MKVNITYNETFNGLELHFDPKPKKEITTFLKELGFLFNYQKLIWYVKNPTPQKKEIAHQVKSLLENNQSLSELIIVPSFEPSIENIDHKNFSYVSIQYKNSEGTSSWKNYVLFEPTKKIAQFIANKFAKWIYGDAVVSVNVAERNYKRKARVLFDNGDVLVPELESQEKNLVKTNTLRKDTPTTNDLQNRFNQKGFEVIEKEQEITPLYHGTCIPFERFDKQFLGSISGDIPSHLGYHFTPNENLAKQIFANEPHKDSFENCRAYEVGIKVTKTLKTSESALVKDILRWGIEQNIIINKQEKLLQLLQHPYYSSDEKVSIVGTLNSEEWEDKGVPYINYEILAIRYLNEVLRHQGFDSIQYINEIEWASENRYDWIIFDEAQITYNHVAFISSTTEKDASLKQAVQEITLTTHGDSPHPDYDKGKKFNFWSEANAYLKKLVGKVVDVYYKVIWKDNEVMEGMVDLEPSEDFEEKNNILSEWVTTVLTNVSKAKPIDVDQKHIDRAKKLINGYQTVDIKSFDKVLTPKKKLEILTQFGKFHEKREAEFPEVKLEEHEIQMQFHGWLRTNYPELLYHKDSIWEEKQHSQNNLSPDSKQAKKLSNEHGFYSKETAGDNYENISVPIPKSAKYRANIELVKDEEGMYRMATNTNRLIEGDVGYNSLLGQHSQQFKTRKIALEAALDKLITTRILIGVDASTKDIDGDETKEAALAVKKFAIDNELEPAFLTDNWAKNEQMKNLTNEHGVYTKATAGEKFEKIEIPIPKTAKYEASISIVKDEDNLFRMATSTHKQFGDASGGSSPVSDSSKQYKTKKEALNDAVTEIYNRISKEIKSRDSILNNEERKNKMLNSALKAVEQFAIDNDLKPDFLLDAETSREKSTEENIRKITEEVIEEFTALEIDLEGEDETIIATTRMDLEEALNLKTDKQFKVKLKEAIQSFKDWIMDVADGKLRADAILAMYKIIDMIGENPIESLVDTPSQNPIAETKKAVQPKKKNQLEINKEIEDFIDSKHNEDFVYQEDTINFLSQYTGSGGLIKQGASGKGILYEYFTPDAIVKKMWGLAEKYGYNGGAVLEPSCGIGNFIKYAPKSAKVVGYETNYYSSKIAEIIYPRTRIYNQSFESIFFAGNVHLKNDFGGAKYDLVIGNPPYGTFLGKWAGMGEKKFTGAIEYDQYFITRGLDLLRKNGLLIFIVPSSFLSNASKYNKIKEKIGAKADLIDAYRLPQRAFSTTDIGTDIVVFKKL